MKIFSKLILGLSLSFGSTYTLAQDVESMWVQIAHCSGQIENEHIEIDLSFKPGDMTILMTCWSGNEPKISFTTKTIENSRAVLSFIPEADVKYAYQFESFKYFHDKLYVQTTKNEYLLNCKLLGPF